MAKSSRKRRAHVVWDEPSAADSSQSLTSHPPKKKIKDVTISVSKDGHTSTRTAYVPVDASPKKTVPRTEQTPINWIHSAPEPGGDDDDDDWVDVEGVDPDYNQHIKETQVALKKPKRAAPVCLLFPSFVSTL